MRIARRDKIGHFMIVTGCMTLGYMMGGGSGMGIMFGFLAFIGGLLVVTRSL